MLIETVWPGGMIEIPETVRLEKPFKIITTDRDKEKLSFIEAYLRKIKEENN